MQIQEINGQRILTPEDNKYLYSANAKAIVRKAQLGKEADASEWVEITQEEKEVLESETKSETEATEQDYQNALMEMGVKFDE